MVQFIWGNLVEIDRFHIKQDDRSLSAIFSILEKLKADNYIDNYSISQTSLEQVNMTSKLDF